ncbi:hypothetical protein CRG98_049751 [Punica granatum]|uniref:Secreted protein n=1 Tax=Punica granatum TaxID=22663 RepID=A0A2I0H2R5_PUNGR|nr:hypothetical protein CRG98_049751 [Punica granatum]
MPRRILMIFTTLALVLDSWIEVRAGRYCSDLVARMELPVYVGERDRQGCVLPTRSRLCYAALLTLRGWDLLHRLRSSRSRGSVLLGLRWSGSIMVDDQL